MTDGFQRRWQSDGQLHRRGGGGIPDVALLLLGEFQSVAEDLDSRLFITVSTCLGRLTVDTEHLPKKPRERHTDVHTGHMVERKNGNFCGVMRCARMMPPQTHTHILWSNRSVMWATAIKADSCALNASIIISALLRCMHAHSAPYVHFSPPLGVKAGIRGTKHVSKMMFNVSELHKCYSF